MWNRFNKVVILKILVAPLLVFSVASVPAQGIEDAWKSSFDAGETALNKGALREALREALRGFPAVLADDYEKAKLKSESNRLPES